MIAKVALGIAVVLATASGALAATKADNTSLSRSAHTNVYNPSGACARWFQWPCSLGPMSSN
jgi:hypothetical protein